MLHFQNVAKPIKTFRCYADFLYIKTCCWRLTEALGRKCVRGTLQRLLSPGTSSVKDAHLWAHKIDYFLLFNLFTLLYGFQEGVSLFWTWMKIISEGAHDCSDPLSLLFSWIISFDSCSFTFLLKAADILPGMLVLIAPPALFLHQCAGPFYINVTGEKQ